MIVELYSTQQMKSSTCLISRGLRRKNGNDGGTATSVMIKR